MKYFAQYNDLGHYVSFYTTNAWKEEDIPTSNVIEITEEQWREAIEKKCGIINGVHSVIEPSKEDVNNYLMSHVRSERNKLLSSCDWTVLSDSPLTDSKKQEWILYRQALRDLPATVDINNIVYPKKP